MIKKISVTFKQGRQTHFLVGLNEQHGSEIFLQTVDDVFLDQFGDGDVLSDGKGVEKVFEVFRSREGDAFRFLPESTADAIREKSSVNWCVMAIYPFLYTDTQNNVKRHAARPLIPPGALPIFYLMYCRCDDQIRTYRRNCGGFSFPSWLRDGEG